MAKKSITKGAARQFRKLRRLQGKLKVQLRRTKDKAKKIDRKVNEMTRKYPRRALLIAAATGALIAAGAAYAMRRRRRR